MTGYERDERKQFSGVPAVVTYVFLVLMFLVLFATARLIL